MQTLADIVLDAYREGIFPMAENAKDEAFAFYKPYQRGLIPIKGLHIPGKLRKTLRQRPYKVTLDQAFEAIIDGCAQTSAVSSKRNRTWINPSIKRLFIELHKEGHAHSLECWNQDGQLAGGLYGLAIGAVFCGESMVSFQRDSSKIALVHLCAALWKNGFTVLDSQFLNPHLLQFGAYEIPQQEYEDIIKTDMQKNVSLPPYTPQGLEDVLNEYLRDILFRA